MKQTNNAITFLMAHYRSIFKNAYLKGLTTAAILTIGLSSAASVQAAKGGDFEKADLPALQAGNHVIINGSGSNVTGDENYKQLKLTLAADADGALNIDLNGTLKVVGGIKYFKDPAALNDGHDTKANYIKLSTDTNKTEIKFGNKDKFNVLVETDDVTKGFAIETDGKAVKGTSTLLANDFSINKGGVDIVINKTNKSGSFILDANTINIGQASTDEVTTPSAVLYLGNKTADAFEALSENATITIGNANTTTTLNDTGAIYFFAPAAKPEFIVLNGKLNGQGGLLDLSSGSGTIKAVSYHEDDKNITEGTLPGTTFNINIGATQTTKVALAPTTEKRGVLHFGSDSVVTLNQVNGSDGAILDVTSGSATVGSIIKFDKGSVITVKSDGNANASKSGSYLAIAGKAETKDYEYSELLIDSNVLGSFLSSDIAVSGGSTDTAGSLLLKGNTKTTITDDDTLVNIVGSAGASGIDVDNPNTVNIAVSGSAKAPQQNEAGKIYVSGKENNLYAKNLQVSSKIEGIDGNTTILRLKTENLTLGGNEYTANNGLGLNSGVDAKNVTFLAKGKDFVLADTVNLSSTYTTKNHVNADILHSDSGSITNNVVITSDKGILNVQGGVYTADKITLREKGSVVVSDTVPGNTTNKAEDFESNLTVNELVFTKDSTNDASTIKATGADAVLTINKFGFADGKHDSKGAIVADDGANVYLDGLSVQAVLDNAYTNKNPELKIKGAKTASVGATVHVKDADLEIKADSANDNALKVFDFVSGTTLELGSLTLNLDNVNDQSFKFNGELDAQSLNIQTKGAEGANIDAFTLGDGTYTLHSSLDSNSKSLILNGTASAGGGFAHVNLGQIVNYSDDPYFYDVYKATTQGGSVNVETLNVAGNGSLAVNAGDWSLQNLIVSGGRVDVGNNDHFYNIDDELISASLTGAKLSVESGTFNVDAAGSASFSGLNAASANGVLVSGELRIAGGLVGTDEADPNKTNEVKLASGAVKVNSNANLIFGVDALSNSVMSGNTINTTNISQDAISIENNGMVTFEFDKGEFTADELKALKSYLFANDVDGSINGVLNIGKASIKGLSFNEDGSISWNTLKPVKDVSSDVTNIDLMNAKVTGVDSPFKSHVGSVESTAQRLTVDGNSSLNNASGNKGFYVSYNGAAADVSITNNSDLALRNGGVIGTVMLSSADASLTTGGSGTTTITAVSGGKTSAFNVGADTVVSKNVNVGELYSNQEGKLNIQGQLDVSGRYATLYGTTKVAGDAKFAGELELQNAAEFNQDLYVKDDTYVYGNTTVAGIAKLEQSVEIGNGALFNAKAIDLSNKVNGGAYVLAVGEDKYLEHGKVHEGSTGYLSTEALKLAGNTLIVDPEYGQKTAIAAIKQFKDTTESLVKDGGVANGNLIVGKNAALFIGADATLDNAKSFLAQYQDSNGSLSADYVGSVLYIGDKLTLSGNKQIILDAKRSQNEILGSRELDINGALTDGKSYYGKFKDSNNLVMSDLYLGANTILAVGDRTIEQGGAIYFDKEAASIMAADSTTKIVLDGDNFLGSRKVSLFNDKGGNGVNILGDQSIRVETLNGLMYFMLEAGSEVDGGVLGLDISKVKHAYLGASQPMRDYLISYASRTNNWYEYFNQDGTNTEVVYRDFLVDGLADSSLASIVTDQNGQQTIVLTAEAQKLGLTTSDFEIINNELYRLAHNNFLEQVVRNTDGAAADQAARIGVLGGAANAAYAASQSSAEAITSRYGIGSGLDVSSANNGQGTSMWLTPLYKSIDASGFAAQGASYGHDLDIYGLALGADYTLSSGVSFGAMFNIGSGDVDGKGLGSNIQNDFNYYGFGLYAGYSMNQLSIVGDFSYNVVDSDIEANTAIDKVKSSFDTKALTLGVTAQYNINLGGVEIAPHAALRYTKLDMDNYSFADSNGHIGDFASDSASVFSIPVGVSIAKSFVGETWTIKPSIDFSVAGNFGDDEISGDARFDGVNRNIATKAEFIDSFTYGAKAALSFQSQNTTIGVGLNYTGSSNTDEFGVSANARYVF